MYREEYSAPESVLFNKAKLKVIFLNIELEKLEWRMKFILFYCQKHWLNNCGRVEMMLNFLTKHIEIQSLDAKIRAILCGSMSMPEWAMRNFIKSDKFLKFASSGKISLEKRIKMEAIVTGKDLKSCHQSQQRVRCSCVRKLSQLRWDGKREREEDVCVLCLYFFIFPETFISHFCGQKFHMAEPVIHSAHTQCELMKGMLSQINFSWHRRRHKHSPPPNEYKKAHHSEIMAAKAAAATATIITTKTPNLPREKDRRRYGVSMSYCIAHCVYTRIFFARALNIGLMIRKYFGCHHSTLEYIQFFLSLIFFVVVVVPSLPGHINSISD